MINITARHLDISDDLKDLVYGKAEKLIQYFRRVKKIDIIFTKESKAYKVEMIAVGPRRLVVVANANGVDPLNAFDIVFDKIERRLSKLKGKIRVYRKKRGRAALRKQGKTGSFSGLEQEDWY